MDFSVYLRERILSKIWVFIATVAFLVAVTPLLAVFYGLITLSPTQGAIIGVISLAGLVVTGVSLRRYWYHTRRESAEIP